MKSFTGFAAAWIGSHYGASDHAGAISSPRDAKRSVEKTNFVKHFFGFVTKFMALRPPLSNFHRIFLELLFANAN